MRQALTWEGARASCPSRPSTTKLARCCLKLEGLGEQRWVGYTIGLVGIWAGAPWWRGSSSGGHYSAHSQSALHCLSSLSLIPLLCLPVKPAGGSEHHSQAPPALAATTVGPASGSPARQFPQSLGISDFPSSLSTEWELWGQRSGYSEGSPLARAPLDAKKAAFRAQGAVGRGRLTGRGGPVLPLRRAPTLEGTGEVGRGPCRGAA